MPLKVLNTLIVGPDAWELVRDQTAALLATESANQIALATAAGEPDPSLWKLRVYTERANPWELFLAPDVTDFSPVVNVWLDTNSFDESKGDAVQRQANDVTVNCDIYGYAVARADGFGGQFIDDEYSAPDRATWGAFVPPDFDGGHQHILAIARGGWEAVAGGNNTIPTTIGQRGG